MSNSTALRLNPRAQRMVRYRRLASSLISRFPAFVDFELSLGCNLRCPMCWLHGESAEGNRFAGSELSTAEATAVLEELGRHGSTVYFGGGEPFFRRDFVELLELAGSLGLRPQFTTNGTLIDQTRAHQIVSFGTTHVSISIDGDEAAHDAVRGSGMFEKACATVRRLAKARAARGSLTPRITINMTLNAAFAGQLEKSIRAIIEATDEAADSYRLHHLCFVSPRELEAHQAELQRRLGVGAPRASCHRISAPEELNPSVLEIDIAAASRIPKVQVLPELTAGRTSNYYAESLRSPGHCLASFQSVLIKPNGDVVFCPDDWIDDYILGNVTSAPLAQIWRGPAARRFRVEMVARGALPGCKRCPWFRTNNAAHLSGIRNAAGRK